MSQIDMTFYGATATVTGSKTLVEVAGKRLLVDAGLFQGFKVLRERNWEPLPFDAASIDAVLLTHAHIDHSGALPLLIRQGFKGPIWTSSASADLCEVLLMDTAHLQEEEARFRNRHKATKHEPAEPLYSVKDAQVAIKHLKRVHQGGTVDLGLLSSGMYVAMVTTVMGLIVGIPAYFGYNYLVARIEKLVFQMEANSIAFMDILNQPVQK